MIKNIIFDLGNVLIDIDFPRSEAMLKELLGENLLENLAKNNQKDVFLAYETGKISENEFLDILIHASKKTVERSSIIDAWNAMLIGFKKPRFEMLENLRHRYHLYVLSNTNKTHIDWVHQHLASEFGIVAYENTFFKKVYYSHEIFLRKPTVAIYEYVLRDANLLPQETVFIDDNFDNIAAAKTLGIQTIYHVLGSEITVALRDF
jgi:glucose-1-phosphatase